QQRTRCQQPPQPHGTEPVCPQGKLRLEHGKHQYERPDPLDIAADPYDSKPDVAHKASSFYRIAFPSCFSASARLSISILDTPCSCMVTPYSMSASSMVPRRCVMTMNCVESVSRRMYCANRATLTSSSAASISSSTQNGVGRSLSIAKYSAIATNAFSPPESRVSVLTEDRKTT